MPSAAQIASIMAEMDSRNKKPAVEVETVKSMPAMNLTGLRAAMAGVLPGGWSSDHAAETEKFAGWHYIAIHAIYKQIIQAGIEVYERKLIVPDLQKPQEAPPAPVMNGRPGATVPKMPGAFTKGFNEQQESMHPVPHYDPVMRKLKKPNPSQTLSAFNGERAIQLALTGRAITWNVKSQLTGKIIERYVIPTCLAQPRPPSKELPRGGWYVLPEGARYAQEAGFYMVGTLEAAFGKTIPAEDVQIIKFPHPKFKDDGQSPVSASALWTDTSEMVDKSRHNHLKNGPDPSVVIGLDGEVDETSIRRGEAVFNERYAGVDKHGKAMFVTPAKTITPLTTAPKDMAYGDGFTQLRDAQLAVHGVPLAAVGLTSPTGREGLYAPLLQFTELSVQPILKLLGDEDSALYSNDEGREIEIVYTVKKFNDEELLEKQIQTDIQAGILTKGELRKIRGRDLFGDERDDELCGSQAAPAGQPMIGPDGQPVGPDGQPLPQGQNPETAAEVSKPTKQPFGRAMQGMKPRLANQIAKAFAKELEKYGIVKGGPGSGNHGHCGGEGGDGHPGGSRSAEECGSTTQSQTQGQQQGQSTAQAQPGTEPQPQPLTGGGRLGEANPHAFGIPPAIRRQLSAAAFAAAAEDFGGGTIDEDRERSTVQQIASSIEGREGSISNQVAVRHAEDFYRQERDIARGILFGGNREARARVSETQNLYGISQDEAMAHLANLERGNFVATRVSLLIQSTNRAINVGGHASQADGEIHLARILASEQLAESQIAQAINLLRGMRGVDWSNIEPGDAARIAANATAGYASQPVAPPVQAEPVQSQQRAVEATEPLRYPDDGKIQREYKPRVVPEAIDGTTAKESRILTDVKERAKAVKFADGEANLEKSIDEEQLMQELVDEGLEVYERDSQETADIAERAVDTMKRRVNSYGDLPQAAIDSIDSFLETLPEDVSSSDELKDKTIAFFDNLDDEIDDIISNSTDDESEIEALKSSYDDVRSDFIDEAENAASNFDDMLSESQSEWAQQYASDLFDERLAQMKEEGGDFESVEPNTWYQGDDEAKLKLVTRGGSEFHLTLTDTSYSEKYGIEGGKVGDMIFADKSGSIEITKKGRGEQFEVFRGVSAALLAKMERDGYDVVTYTAIEENRQELYDKLTQTIAQYDGKYVAAVVGGADAEDRNRSANYVVVKREHKEKLQEHLEGRDKYSWLVKRYPNGVRKSFGGRWIRWYDYSKGGPGSGNHGHCGGEGGEGNPGGSKPADQCGGDTVTYISRGKEVTARATGETMEIVAGKEAKISEIKWSEGDVVGRERYTSPNQNLTQFIKENNLSRESGTRIDVVDFAKALDDAAKPMPLYEGKVLRTENIERAGEILADMTLEADKIDSSWPKWYSEIEQVIEELKIEEGEFNLSEKSRKFLKTDAGRALFISTLALTSQEASPAENLLATKNLIDFYSQNGSFPKSDAKLKELIASKAYQVISGNIKTHQMLIDTLGGPKEAFDFLNKEMTVRRLEQVAKSVGLKFSGSVAFKDQVVPVSYVFGPKIGAFHANLGGIEDLLTQDRWLTRTINRISGRIGFTQEQVKESWSEVAKHKPSKGNAEKVGLTVTQLSTAVKKLSEGKEVDDKTMSALSKLASLHISSGPSSKNKEIVRDEFTTALNTADKKTKDVVNSPGSALSRTANQLAAEHAVRVLKSRGKPFSVREVQAAVWMLEKARWYEAGVGNKRGFANSYLSVLHTARKGGINAILKDAGGDEDSGE